MSVDCGHYRLINRMLIASSLYCSHSLGSSGSCHLVLHEQVTWASFSFEEDNKEWIFALVAYEYAPLLHLCFHHYGNDVMLWHYRSNTSSLHNCNGTTVLHHGVSTLISLHHCATTEVEVGKNDIGFVYGVILIQWNRSVRLCYPSAGRNAYQYVFPHTWVTGCIQL